MNAALNASRHLPLDQLTPSTFALGDLAVRLCEISRELEDGCGVYRLEGLPVALYPAEDLRTAFAGIGSHLGVLLDQNGARGMLREIRDSSATGGQRVDSAAALGWHNDRADRVGLLCVQRAARGGLSKLASAAAVHNEMLRRCPDLLDTLFNDYQRFAPGDEVGKTSGLYSMPVFQMSGGRLSVHYSRTYIEQAANLPGSTPLTERQVAALDALVECAEALQFEMPLTPGDMQFLNNHVTLHGRTAFEDGSRDGQTRLLYRLWLSTTANGGWKA